MITELKGFEEDNLAYVELSELLGSGDSLTAEGSRSIISEIKKGLESLPTVETVSQSMYLLSFYSGNTVKVVGSDDWYSGQIINVDHKYFNTIQQDFLAGNNF